MRNEGNKTDNEKACRASFLSLVTAETITSVRSNHYQSMDLRGWQWLGFYRCLTWAWKRLTLSQHWSGWERVLRFVCILSSTSKAEVKKERFPDKLLSKETWNGLCYLEQYLSVWDEVRSAGWRPSCLATLPLCFLAHEKQVDYERRE